MNYYNNNNKNSKRQNMSVETKTMLDKMQQNFENRSYHNNNRQTFNFANFNNIQNNVSTLSNNNASSQNPNQSNYSDNNLSSLLPLLQLMLNKDKKGLEQNSMQEMLLKAIGGNNPLFNELFSMLNKSKKVENLSTEEQKKEEKSISSYTKTNDYNTD